MQRVSVNSKMVKFENKMEIEIPSGFIVCCDMDGTLVDTDFANYLSYRRAIKEVTRGRYDVQLSNTRLNREGLKRQIPCLTGHQCDEIISLKAEYFTEFLSETRLNTTLADFIRKCSGTNETVLVTYCREKRAVETLGHHKLLECFTRLICWEALSGGGSSNKYESALSLMGANSDTIVVFENEISDIEKAVAAGVPRKNINSTVSRPRVQMS